MFIIKIDICRKIWHGWISTVGLYHLFIDMEQDKKEDSSQEGSINWLLKIKIQRVGYCAYKKGEPDDEAADNDLPLD